MIKKFLIPIILIVAGAALLLVPRLMSGDLNNLEVKIENTPVIMPACYKVYGNPEAINGRYFLFKMLITNKGSQAIRNITANYEIPKYIEETELGKIPVIHPGQSVVITCYPTFKDDVVNKTTSSKEKARITLKSGSSEVEEEFGFEMKGRNEFLYTCINPDEIRSFRDLFDNDFLLGCYVTPEDPIVKYYTQQVQEKILRGEQAAVNKDPKEVARVLMGIYQATYNSGMVYSGTSGVPSKFDDLQSLVQSLRLPREVITGNTGLCIELSLLYASVLMAAGLDPVIFLVPGHAYPGVKVQGQYLAIEATGIGGEGLGGRTDVEGAFAKGMKQLEELFKAAQMGDERYYLIDIRELVAQQVTPMELKDDPFLRQKVEKIADAWVNGSLAQNAGSGVSAVQIVNSGGGGNDGGGGGGMRKYSGVVSFNYPSGWQLQNNPYADMLPQLRTVISSPDQMASVEVYQVPGASGGSAALGQLQQQFSMMGVEIQFQQAGSAGGFQVFNGMSTSMNGSINWQAYMKRAGNGTSGVVFSVMPGGEGYQSQLQQIIQTLN
jgi:hypothetical protein